MTHAARRHRPDPDSDENRRQSPRRPASAIPNLKARLFAGSDVGLIDVSRRGVLLETNARLLPGSHISIKFVTTDAMLVLKGSVVRSSVSIVSAKGVVYRTAVAFDEDIKLCESLWEEASAPEPAFDDVPPLQIVHSRDRDERFEPVQPAHPTTVTTVFASSGDDLRKLFVANDL